VFVDGVRVNEPTVEEVNFDLLPLDDVERVELIRGPAAVFGRNTIGGGINYNPTRNIDVYFSYAEGFRAPSFLELTCASPATICPGLQAGVAPDPPLKPVKARNYEVGVRARPWPWLRGGSLSLYRTDVRDDIFLVSPTGTVGLFFQNIGDTRRQGVELGLRGRFWERVEPWLN